MLWCSGRGFRGVGEDGDVLVAERVVDDEVVEVVVLNTLLASISFRRFEELRWHIHAARSTPLVQASNHPPQSLPNPSY